MRPAHAFARNVESSYSEEYEMKNIRAFVIVVLLIVSSYIIGTGNMQESEVEIRLVSENSVSLKCFGIVANNTIYNDDCLGVVKIPSGNYTLKAQYMGKIVNVKKIGVVNLNHDDTLTAEINVYNFTLLIRDLTQGRKMEHEIYIFSHYNNSVSERIKIPVVGRIFINHPEGFYSIIPSAGFLLNTTFFHLNKNNPTIVVGLFDMSHLSEIDNKLNELGSRINDNEAILSQIQQQIMTLESLPNSVKNITEEVSSFWLRLAIVVAIFVFVFMVFAYFLARRFSNLELVLSSIREDTVAEHL